VSDELLLLNELVNTWWTSQLINKSVIVQNCYPCFRRHYNTSMHKVPCNLLTTVENIHFYRVLSQAEIVSSWNIVMANKGAKPGIPALLKCTWTVLKESDLTFVNAPQNVRVSTMTAFNSKKYRCMKCLMWVASCKGWTKLFCDNFSNLTKTVTIQNANCKTFLKYMVKSEVYYNIKIVQHGTYVIAITYAIVIHLKTTK
jgi:hypothetical protein